MKAKPRLTAGASSPSACFTSSQVAIKTGKHTPSEMSIFSTSASANSLIY